MFTDRFDAAKQLSRKLEQYKGNKDAIILAIPRGALQIGFQMAKDLRLKLDIIITKKIGHPYSSEFAIGSVGLGEVILDKDIIAMEGIPEEYVDRQIKDLEETIKQRYERYRGKKPFPNLNGKIVIITDDGIATGHTMLAAIRIIKKQNPKKIVVAVPVAPPDAIERLQQEADEVVCLLAPEIFFAIGEFYKSFEQVEDDEAIRYLDEANK